MELPPPPGPAPAVGPIAGLTGVRKALERVRVRLRGGALTRSAWRLTVTADEGTGTIIQVETVEGEVSYRGDGLFLGLSQGELKAVWEAPRDLPEEPAAEMPQLG